ncbi:MAG: hypothetical protein ACC707_08280 [Thiohalomonadales bacterium]
MFRKLRILFLLLLLLGVAVDTWLSKVRSTDWDEPLRIVIYPINGDDSPQSQTYIEALRLADFKAIEDFMVEEAGEFQLSLHKPVDIYLSNPMQQRPPTPPADRNSILAVMWWSLKMRYWAFFEHNYKGPKPDVKVFVLYHDPETNRELPHSLGLEKGLIGVVNGFASARYAGTNQVVITHEMLHTLGATDKYDVRNGRPLFPAGYVDPDKKPLYPQDLAEIMAGQIPLSETTFRMPNNLDETVIGHISAFEINWVAQ